MPESSSQPPPPVDIAQLVGALAEAGVQELVYAETHKPPRTLHARVTDLPGILRAAPIGAEVRTLDQQTRLIHESDGWRLASSR